MRSMNVGARRVVCVAVIACGAAAGAVSARAAVGGPENAELIFTPYPVPEGELPQGWRAAHDSAATDSAESAERSADEERIRASIEAELGSIAREEALNGPNSSALIEPLTLLGRLYQELDEHDRAIGAFERALDISRIHQGLYSIEYSEIIERLIASWTEVGEFGVAGLLDEELIELVRRNPDDVRGAAILTKVADRQMSDVERYLELDEDSSVWIGMSTQQSDVPTLRRLALRALRRARGLYGWAQNIAIANSDDIDEYVGLQEKIIETYYYELENDSLRSSHSTGPPPGLGGSGKRVLEIQLENSYNYPGTPVAIAEAMIELADWTLLFALNGQALRKYEAVQDFLSSVDAPAEQVERLLSPEVPAVLPAFGADIDVVDPASGYLGYVDVAIETTRYGRTKSYEILGATPTAGNDVLRKLKRVLGQSRFRPRFEDGELVRNDYFALRYYFDY